MYFADSMFMLLFTVLYQLHRFW